MKTILDHFEEKNVQAIHEFARAGKLSAAIKLNTYSLEKSGCSIIEYAHHILQCFDRQLIDLLFNNYVKYSQIEYDEFISLFNRIVDIAQDFDNTNILIQLLFNTAFSQSIDVSCLMPKSIMTTRSYIENAVPADKLLKNAPPYLEVTQYLLEHSKVSQKRFSQDLLDYTINLYAEKLQQKDQLDFYKILFLYGATLPQSSSKTLRKQGAKLSIFAIDSIFEYSPIQCANLSSFNYNVYLLYQNNIDVLKSIYSSQAILNRLIDAQFDREKTRNFVELHYK